MPTRLSTALGVTKKELKDKGVFDSIIDFDSRLHIDPALLSKCRIPEFIKANEKVATYFTDVLSLIHGSTRDGDALWRAASKKLTFGEGLNSGLGYSKKGTGGSGIGKDMAERILQTAKEVIDAGINDPRIFELVPLFEDKIGPDRISDMISIILAQEFNDFTIRVAEELGVNLLIGANGKPIVFVPRSLLNDLPISAQWEDVAIAAEYNEGIRDSINSIVNLSWKKAAADNKKEDFKKMLLRNPELLKELLENYKKRSANGYNFFLDHIGITIWDILGPQTAIEYPLDLKHYTAITSENILEIVRKIAFQYKKLIENNGLVEHLYDEQKDRRPERFPQLLFYSIADSYCNANELDLNREINSGSGALDFKVSSGRAKVNLEIKYSSNPKLIEGFTKQLPTYNSAEGIEDRYSIYLVLRVNKNQDSKLSEIRRIIADRKIDGIYSPELIVVDAMIQPSASKRT